jgi:hypothetical protein
VNAYVNWRLEEIWFERDSQDKEEPEMKSRRALLPLIVLILVFVTPFFYAEAGPQIPNNHSSDQVHVILGNGGYWLCPEPVHQEIPEYYIGRMGQRERLGGRPIERYAEQHQCSWIPKRQ